MIRVVVPARAASTNVDKRPPATAKTLFSEAVRMVKAEAWQTGAALDDFAFDPSSMPDPPNRFTTVTGRLARTLYGHWNRYAEPVPRTITWEGGTETTWPKRIGVPLFMVEAPSEQRRIYLAEAGFVTARFPHRRVEVSRHGRYTTGLLGGRTARAVAEALDDALLDSASATIALWPLHPACATAYSLLARTLLSMAATVLDEEAPELRSRMVGIDFAQLMDDAVLRLTVDEVHAH